MEVKDLVIRQLGSTSLFAAKFREAASRALLLPKRRPGVRAPLVAATQTFSRLAGSGVAIFDRFPFMLEAYRECIRDVFDLPALTSILAGVQRGSIRVTNLESDRPSPFAASLLFSYVANYIYDGDAPLAERRAQALSIDQSRLEELLGDVDLRELLDSTALDEVEARLQSLDPEYRARHADGVHDLLLKLGDLTEPELLARSENAEVAADHFRAAEFAACGADSHCRRHTFHSRGICFALSRCSWHSAASGTRGSFSRAERRSVAGDFAALCANPRPLHDGGCLSTLRLATRRRIKRLRTLHGLGKLLEGEFRPGGTHHEWCDPEVMQQIRRKSLARLRREIEPVEQSTFARFTARWQGVSVRRRGLESLLDTVENLQGATLLISELEREILPARIADYRPADLDMVMASGQVVWVGVEQVGNRDGRVALYLSESLPALLPPQELRSGVAELSERARQVLDFLTQKGASFFAAIHAGLGGGYPGETRDALWELVWAGQITNDTFHPLRDLLRSSESQRQRSETFAGAPPGSPDFVRRFRSHSGGQAQGRWSLIGERVAAAISVTEWSANLAQQLLVRHGIVLRETAIAESVPRGYPMIYPALKIMEDGGWVRRGNVCCRTGRGAICDARCSRHAAEPAPGAGHVRSAVSGSDRSRESLWRFAAVAATGRPTAKR